MLNSYDCPSKATQGGAFYFPDLMLPDRIKKELKFQFDRYDGYCRYCFGLIADVIHNLELNKCEDVSEDNSDSDSESEKDELYNEFYKVFFILSQGKEKSTNCTACQFPLIEFNKKNKWTTEATQAGSNQQTQAETEPASLKTSISEEEYKAYLPISVTINNECSEYVFCFDCLNLMSKHFMAKNRGKRVRNMKTDVKATLIDVGNAMAKITKNIKESANLAYLQNRALQGYLWVN